MTCRTIKEARRRNLFFIKVSTPEGKSVESARNVCVTQREKSPTRSQPIQKVVDFPNMIAAGDLRHRAAKPLLCHAREPCRTSARMLQVGHQRMDCYLPPAHAQPFGQVEQAEGSVSGFKVQHTAGIPALLSPSKGFRTTQSWPDPWRHSAPLRSNSPGSRGIPRAQAHQPDPCAIVVVSIRSRSQETPMGTIPAKVSHNIKTAGRFGLASEASKRTDRDERAGPHPAACRRQRNKQ